MLIVREDINIEANLLIRLIDPRTRREVPGSRREAHNVFTTTGRDWLAHLCVWGGVGTGPGGADVALTQRRLRWMGVGTGTTQLEVEGVTSLETPVPVDESGNYLAPIQGHTFPAVKQVRVFKEFSTTEISTSITPVVPITEAGLFVDIFPVSANGGTDDSAVGFEDTTLSRLVQFNAPVAYKQFDVINKTQDFNLEIRWEFRF
jgi:hypothetical protein